MAKGAAAPVGSERWSANGYHYTKSTTGWILTHRMLMEQKLGRSLLPHERVTFKNNNKRDIRIDNLELTEVKNDRTKLLRRKASIEDKIREFEAMLEEVNEELAKDEKSKLNGASA
jgi:hypothetical protein